MIRRVSGQRTGRRVVHMGTEGRVLKVAAVQMSPVLFDRDATTEKVIQWIGKCGDQGVRLAVFPETIVPNYPYFAWVQPPAVIAELQGRLFDQAVEVPGPVTEAVGDAAAAAGTLVVLGVNERDGGTLYNTQLIFDADGRLVARRRKIMPTFHERMIWGRGDGSGLKVYETTVGRIGALICWEHYMPLARYALMVDGEEIHCSHFPGCMGGDSMAKQIDAAIRHHAVESGAFVVNATGWLTEDQKTELAPDASLHKYLKGGNCTAVVAPYGLYLAGPLGDGEGMAVAEIDLKAIIRQKNVLDTAGHYARPDILRLRIDRSVHAIVEEMRAVREELLQIPVEDPEIKG
jgi:aliphatic nitrilase